MPKAIFILSILIAFLSGYLIASNVNTTHTHDNMTTTAISNPSIPENITSSDTLLIEKLDTILLKLNTLNVNTTIQEETIVDNHKKPDNTFAIANEEIESVKDNIYNSLLEPDFTLMKLTNSNDLNNLPEADKKEILDEVARRIEAGEIQLDSFLPGYNQ